MVVNVRKVVRSVARRPSPAVDDIDYQARWDRMLSELERETREIEQRLARAERALNRPPAGV
jgi:hypothetical protein